MGGDGSGSGCGRWWLVVVSVRNGGGFHFCSGFLMVGF